MSYDRDDSTQDTDTAVAQEEAAQEEAREKLEEETSKRLEEAFADDDDSDEEPEEEGSEEGEGEGEETDEGSSEELDDDTDQSSDEGDEEEGDEVDEEAAAEGDQSSDAPTLPDAYRRSLYAYGWKDDEIDSNLRNLGDSFIKTAERIHTNRNTELQQWAQAGRQARGQQDMDGGQQTGGDGRQDGAQADKPGELPQQLNPVDAAKLKEQFGEDELIDAIVSPVNATIKSLNSILPQIQQGQQAAQQAEVERVSKQVEQFFGRDDMKSYTELYGNGDELSDQQLEKRNQVLDTAYDLMVGANSLRGQKLSLTDALDHAHEITAKDYKDTATRNGLKKQAKQRNRSISQKPSRRTGSGDSSPSDRPKSREDLEKRTKDRMKEVFGD